MVNKTRINYWKLVLLALICVQFSNCRNSDDIRMQRDVFDISEKIRIEKKGHNSDSIKLLALGQINEKYQKIGRWLYYDKNLRVRKTIFYNNGDPIYKQVWYSPKKISTKLYLENCLSFRAKKPQLEFQSNIINDSILLATILIIDYPIDLMGVDFQFPARNFERDYLNNSLVFEINRNKISKNDSLKFEYLNEELKVIDSNCGIVLDYSTPASASL